MGELEKLEPLRSLVELSVVSNAVARRMLHRPLLVFRMPNLHIIDGIPISEEERAKADMYFMEQQVRAARQPTRPPSWQPSLVICFFNLVCSFMFRCYLHDRVVDRVCKCAFHNLCTKFHSFIP